MLFRFWFFANKVGMPLLFVMAFTGLSLDKPWLGEIPLVLLISLGVGELFTGFLIFLDILRMRCPFCGLLGTIGGNKMVGKLMNCPSCGLIHGGGTIGLTIVRERFAEIDGSPIPRTLEETPADLRPSMLPLFPGGWKYFRTWQSLRWFFVLLLPLVGSCAAAMIRHRPDASIMVAVFGLVVAGLLFIMLASGRTSSNSGTYFRSREPFQYWREVAIIAVVYVGLGTVGWLVR